MANHKRQDNPPTTLHRVGARLRRIRLPRNVRPPAFQNSALRSPLSLCNEVGLALRANLAASRGLRPRSALCNLTCHAPLASSARAPYLPFVGLAAQLILAMR